MWWSTIDRHVEAFKQNKKGYAAYKLCYQSACFKICVTALLILYPLISYSSVQNYRILKSILSACYKFVFILFRIRHVNMDWTVQGRHVPVRYVPVYFIPARYVPVRYIPAFLHPRTFPPWSAGFVLSLKRHTAKKVCLLCPWIFSLRGLSVPVVSWYILAVIPLRTASTHGWVG